jgi:hypothetical protein
MNTDLDRVRSYQTKISQSGRLESFSGALASRIEEPIHVAKAMNLGPPG